MFSNTHKEWMAYISEIDEFFGKEPRYPLQTVQQHISTEFRNQNEILIYSANNMSNEITTGIENSTSQICGTLENGFNSLIETNSSGFSQISSDLNMIDDTLNRMSNILNWGFSETIEQIKASNILLGNIAILLKIPDFQKESEAYIKEGMKFFKNAMFNKKRYNDALENFLLAEKKAKTNYFLLQKIGLVYMYSKDNLNIKKALEYFLKASDYSFDETHENSVKTTNYLEKEVSIDFKNQARQILDIKTQTAYSYIYAGRCYYILNDYKNALKYATKAYSLMPSILEGGYDKAKYLSKLDKVDSALELISELINKDKYISLKVVNDFDLISKQKIINYLENISIKNKTEFNNYVKHFKTPIHNKQLKEQIDDFFELAKNPDFINSRIGIEKSNVKYEYHINIVNLVDKINSIYSTTLNKVNTTPKKCYDYLVYTQDKTDTLKSHHELNKQYAITDKIVFEYKKKVSNLKESQMQQFFAIFGLFTISVSIYWWIFINYPDSFLDRFVWLLFAYGGFLGYFPIRDYYSTLVKSKVPVQTLKKYQSDLLLIKSKINKLDGIISNYDLAKIDEIL